MGRYSKGAGMNINYQSGIDSYIRGPSLQNSNFGLEPWIKIANYDIAEGASRAVFCWQLPSVPITAASITVWLEGSRSYVTEYPVFISYAVRPIVPISTSTHMFFWHMLGSQFNETTITYYNPWFPGIPPLSMYSPANVSDDIWSVNDYLRYPVPPSPQYVNFNQGFYTFNMNAFGVASMNALISAGSTTASFTLHPYDGATGYYIQSGYNFSYIASFQNPNASLRPKMTVTVDGSDTHSSQGNFLPLLNKIQI